MSLITKYLAKGASRLCVLSLYKTHVAFSLVRSTWDSHLFAISLNRWVYLCLKWNRNQTGAAYDVKVKYASQVVECRSLLIQDAQLFRLNCKEWPILWYFHCWGCWNPRYIQIITWKTILQEEQETTLPFANQSDIWFFDHVTQILQELSS